MFSIPIPSSAQLLQTTRSGFISSVAQHVKIGYGVGLTVVETNDGCILLPSVSFSVNHLGWNSWETWSQCTKTCGEAIRSRSRTCSSANNQDCEGKAAEERPCNLKKCQSNYVLLCFVLTLISLPLVFIAL